MTVAESHDTMGRLDEIARLLAVQIRMATPSQADAIVELGRAGISYRRIAELLGTTANTTNVTLQRAKKAGKLKGAANA
jgi:DNA-directed RNA polymerase specialized sigma24 family protein